MTFCTVMIPIYFIAFVTLARKKSTHPHPHPFMLFMIAPAFFY